MKNNQEIEVLENNIRKHEFSDRKNEIPRTESEIINAFINKEKFENPTIIRDAKIDLVSPIGKDAILFDSYIKTENEELFIEVKSLPLLNMRFQQQFNAVKFYNLTNKANATFVVIIRKEAFDHQDTKINERRKINYQNMRNAFEKDIKQGLIKIDIL